MAREKKIAYTYKELIVPTYETLLELGGSGTNDEICAQVIKAMNLPDEVVDEPHLGNINQTELEYQLAWARTYLKNFGVIINSGRSVWAIAPDYTAILRRLNLIQKRLLHIRLIEIFNVD